MEEKKIVQYEIARSGTMPALIQEVNKMIKDGYEPFGNVFVISSIMGQPMIKKEN